MIVLDASVMIGYLDRTDLQHERSVAVLADLATEVLVTSPITLAEVLVGPARAGRIEVIMNRLAQLPIGTVELDRESPARLASLRARTSLRMPDCCVLLATEQVTGQLATFDDRLRRVALDLGLRCVEIVDPD